MSGRTKRGSELLYCQLNHNERARQKSPSRGFFFAWEKGMMERDRREVEIRVQKSEVRKFLDSGSWILCADEIHR
jgi:hypothetical protein